MVMLHRSVTSKRNLCRACVDAQQPTDMETFKSHFRTPSAAAPEISGPKEVVLILEATNNGRLRATLPKAPKAFPANRHTVRQQDSDERPRQRVITVSVSAESQSYSPSSKQEPNRRMCAVLWSSLSQRRSKDTSAGARISAAHSASLWMELRYELEG